MIFEIYARGVATSRDAWVYSYSRKTVETNMRHMIENYNSEVDHYIQSCKGKPKEHCPDIDDVVDADPKRLSWSRGLKEDARKGRKYAFESESIVPGLYRPFSKQWLYFNRRFNDMVYQIPRLFPTPSHPNIVISVTGIGAGKPFSALIANIIPNLHLHDTGQCFPLYYYEKEEPSKSKPMDRLYSDSSHRSGTPGKENYIRHEAITDWALQSFKKQYRDDSIGKEEIFYYVYGLLHSPEYRSRYANDLRKMLTRIPFASDFWGFSKAGRELAHWHLNYETVDPFPLEEQIDENKISMMTPKDSFGWKR
ncbi:MAG: type III restriction enzyme, res subunit [Leptospirillum sp. Group IV 'UBA BS']|nr:MAG: type III restriction enzyme, res subunit [Leptospirillum sp. Group IV 'UBA BS']